MQSEGYIEAEASCLKKYQPSQNESSSVNPNPPLKDAEKAEVNNVEASVTVPTVVEVKTNPALNDKGIFEQSNGPEPDNSSDTDEEKDDFPEGGLRA